MQNQAPMRTGTATLPLHGGRAPRWLTDRMAVLGREIFLLMARELGAPAILERLSDPFWFQALGCVLGFDWHSSGVTTTVCGALKQGLEPVADEIGLYICGGKGGRSRRTPDEIRMHGLRAGIEAEPLVRASRLSAKIDSAAVQDGYQLYHHSFFFDRQGHWCVVQQGMADENDPLGLPHKGFARLYHWLGSKVEAWDSEPQAAICCDRRGQLTLNLVAPEGEGNRGGMTSLIEWPPDRLLAEIERLPSLRMDARHQVLAKDVRPDRIRQILLRTYEQHPGTFVNLLGETQVGPKTLRALSLVSELVYGAAPSFRDPARYSFAHGGKDGTPYPVDRAVYGQTIHTLKDLLNSSGIEYSEKRKAFQRLASFERQAGSAAGSTPG